MWPTSPPIPPSTDGPRRANQAAQRRTLGPVTTELSPGAETIEDRRTSEALDDGDHDRFSHYARKDKLTEAMVMGTPVVALCGKVWVPSRDPQKFGVCPVCKEIWESLSGGDDDGAGDE